MSKTCDAAELPEASAVDHPADHMLNAYCPRCEAIVDAACPTCHSSLEPAGATTDGAAHSELSRAEFYRRFVNYIQGSRNAKFTLGCYLIASGDAFAEGVSMTDFAREWGVKKQTVSKQCKLICAYLGLKPSRYMRKAETADKFRRANRRPRKI